MESSDITFQVTGGKQMPLLKHAGTGGHSFPYLYFPLLEGTGMVKHCFTTRLGGVSKGCFESLNLSFERGDERQAVEENFRRVSAALGVEYGNLITVGQAHTTNVVRVGKKDAGNGLTKGQGYPGVDGLITNEPGLTLCTIFADCVPLYFVDTKRQAIGLAHSGWRGTVCRMGEAVLLAMGREFGTLPEDVVCAIGPSICQGCYEVSEEVALEFKREFPEHEGRILYQKGNGKYQLDLWRANEAALLEAGVEQENLAVSSLCTCCNPNLLFSHRASHGKRGNLGAFLCLG